MRKIYDFLRKNNPEFKWSMLKFWIKLRVFKTYILMYSNPTTEGIQFILLIKKQGKQLMIEHAYLNFNIISEEDTVQQIKLNLQYFSFKGFTEVTFPLKSYNSKAIKFITTQFGDDFRFELDDFKNSKLKLNALKTDTQFYTLKITKIL